MTVDFSQPGASAEPVDLLLRVRIRPAQGGLVLLYELTSPSGHLGLQCIEAESERLNVADLKREHVRFFSGLERLLRRLDEDNERLLGEEIGDELQACGQDLYLRLFPDPLKDFYRRHRGRIRSFLVVSDEPWIPWELIRPDEFEDDDFLCLRFPMGRWFAGAYGPALAIQVERLLCVEAAEVQGYPVLPSAREERERLAVLVTEIPGLTGEILKDVRFAELTDRLKRGGFDLIHFAGHADQDAEEPDRSKLVLTDRPFHTSKLVGKIQQRIREDRPLVFLDTRRVARSDLALTGLGGWADRWVRLCRCGALLCPQWGVRDNSASTFSKIVYSRLREGATLGEAVLVARHRLREADPADTSYLAYSLYGHPNTRVTFSSDIPAVTFTFSADDTEMGTAHTGARSSSDHRKMLSSLTIFLCHATEDKNEVRQLYHKLRKKGVRVWLDEEDLLPGQNWQMEIHKAIQSSHVVVACLSGVSTKKEGFVHKEIAQALDIAEEKPENTIYIIPLRLDECEIPRRLSRWHYVDMFSENGFDKLMRALIYRAEMMDNPS